MDLANLFYSQSDISRLISERKEAINIWTVYLHINKTNGKGYVGITSQSVKDRWKNGYGYSAHLPIGRAFRKYGWDGFSHYVLFENLSENEAKSTEKALIESFRTQEDRYGYNLTKGGDGLCGFHFSDETKEKISQSAKALNRSGESNPNYGNKWSKEQRDRASIAKRRENLSEDTLRKMSESAKALNRTGENNTFYGKKHSDATKARLSELRSRHVGMFDQSGIFLKDYPSIKYASIETGINKVAISNCCRGATKSSGGYTWKYLD